MKQNFKQTTHAPFGKPSPAEQITSFSQKILRWDWVQHDAEAAEFWKKAFGQKNILWQRINESVRSKFGCESNTYWEPVDPAHRASAKASVPGGKSAWVYLCAVQQVAERGEFLEARSLGYTGTQFSLSQNWV